MRFRFFAERDRTTHLLRTPHMASLLDGIMQQLGGDTMRQLSQHIGADETTTNSAVGAAIPVLMGALAKNASSPDGAAALAGALDKDHDGSMLGNIAGMLGGGAGAGILKHVLGGRQDTVAAGIGQAAGLDGAQAGKLLAMLAPIVMGALGSAKKSGGLDAGGLAAMLGQERSAIGAQANGGLGSLMSLLDADHDGSVVDDVAGMIGKMFSR